MDKYVCDLCGYVYDPAAGDPDILEQALMTFPLTGHAQFAELKKTIFPRHKKKGDVVLFLTTSPFFDEMKRCEPSPENLMKRIKRQTD